MLFIGTRLIPKRLQKEERFEEIGTMPFFAEMMIPPGSPLTDKTLQELNLGSEFDLNVVRLIRKDNPEMLPVAGLRLQEGDILIVEGGKEEILKVKGTTGIDLTADVLFSDLVQDTADIKVAEAIVLLRSPLVGRTLKGTRFRERYGVQILAVNRHGETIQQKIEVVFQLEMYFDTGDRTSIAASEGFTGLESRDKNTSQSTPGLLYFFDDQDFYIQHHFLPMQYDWRFGCSPAVLRQKKPP
jgi:Trk K+ transport system NAD-binding subunit